MSAKLFKAGRIFSGIQPTGIPHLGNYFGAIKNWVDLQNRTEEDRSRCIFSIVDLHALTTRPNPANLRERIIQSCAILLACGISPDKSSLFLQSLVPQHAQLSWTLSCFASYGNLKRMSQWKEKSKSSPKTGITENVGLFTYPVLQAADILLYGAEFVPVGIDQKQHIELTRDIAEAFNAKYGQEIFFSPKPIYSKIPKVHSLRDPAKKMSKSDTDRMSHILLTDSPDDIRNKIKKAVTDSIVGIWYDETERSGVANLMRIYSAVSGKTIESLNEDYKESNTSNFKCIVSDALIEHLSPIRSEYTRIIKDPGFIEAQLKEGSERVETIARKNYSIVQEFVYGFKPLYE